MSNVYLIGFMGVGKSTAGKKLASKIGHDFIDTDKVFEKKYKLGIDAFFSKYGEDLFRKLEHQILLDTFSNNRCVISTGGGMSCYLDSIDKMNKNGISVYLEMNSKAILNRLLTSKQKRPLVKNMKDDELLLFIRTMLRNRSYYYEKANIIIPALSISITKLSLQLKEFGLKQ